MLFTLPKDMMQLYDPKKDIKNIRNLSAETKQHFENWVPFPEVTLKEAELFLETQFKMQKVEVDKGKQQVIKEYLKYQHFRIQYVCSYQFAMFSDWEQWALKQEIEVYDMMKSFREKSIRTMQHQLESQKNTDVASLQYSLQLEKETDYVETHKLIHLYTEDGIHFNDMQDFGPIPIVVRFSLLHLLGRAPIPEEAYSYWPFYLQFLIDIQYV